MEDFWYDMEWKISGMEWICLQDFACYGRFPFHSMPWCSDVWFSLEIDNETFESTAIPQDNLRTGRSC